MSSKTARRNPEIVEILLVYLLSMATTDGPLQAEEMRVVQQVAGELGFSSLVFEHLLKMVAAQDSFSRNKNHMHTARKSRVLMKVLLPRWRCWV